MSKDTHRSPGEGSIFKRIDKKGVEWHIAQLYLGRDVNGRKKYKTKWCKTKTKARDALTKLKEDQKQGRLDVDESTTVADYLREWLPVVTPTLEAKSLTSYEQYVNDLWIPSSIGRTRLVKLTALALQRFYSDLPRSPRWIEYAHAVLRAALNDAVDWELLPSNPASRVKLAKAEKREVPIWTPEQLSRFLAAIKADRDESLYIMAIVTGCRASELYGLKWGDVDLKAQSIVIRRKAQRIKGQGVQLIEGAKSDAGRRTIALNTVAVAALHAQRARVGRWQMRTAHWLDNDLVFPREDGGPMDDSASRLKLQRLCKRLELPEIRFHDLRHLHTSLMIRLGAPAKVIQERLGHAGIEITMNTYGHLIEGQDREWAERLGEFFE